MLNKTHKNIIFLYVHLHRKLFHCLVEGLIREERGVLCVAERPECMKNMWRVLPSGQRAELCVGQVSFCLNNLQTVLRRLKKQSLQRNRNVKCGYPVYLTAIVNLFYYIANCSCFVLYREKLSKNNFTEALRPFFYVKQIEFKK